MKGIDIFSINKYYRMSNDELEREASKWNIREYGNSNGTISRQIIISALIQKDTANIARNAFMISVLALLVSIFASVA